MIKLYLSGHNSRHILFHICVMVRTMKEMLHILAPCKDSSGRNNTNLNTRFSSHNLMCFKAGGFRGFESMRLNCRVPCLLALNLYSRTVCDIDFHYCRSLKTFIEYCYRQCSCLHLQEILHARLHCHKIQETFL